MSNGMVESLKSGALRSTELKAKKQKACKNLMVWWKVWSLMLYLSIEFKPKHARRSESGGGTISQRPTAKDQELEKRSPSQPWLCTARYRLMGITYIPIAIGRKPKKSFRAAVSISDCWFRISDCKMQIADCELISIFSTQQIWDSLSNKN